MYTAALPTYKLLLILSINGFEKIRILPTPEAVVTVSQLMLHPQGSRCLVK